MTSRERGLTVVQLAAGVVLVGGRGRRVEHAVAQARRAVATASCMWIETRDGVRVGRDDEWDEYVVGQVDRSVLANVALRPAEHPERRAPHVCIGDLPGLACRRFDQHSFWVRGSHVASARTSRRGRVPGARFSR